jgi:hypothetical protein
MEYDVHMKQFLIVFLSHNPTKYVLTHSHVSNIYLPKGQGKP